MRIQMIAIQSFEARGFSRLLTVELHDPHRGEPLLEKRVDAGESRSDLAVGLAHSGAKEMRGKHHERDDDMRDDRESPIHDEHRDADGNQCEQVPESGDDKPPRGIAIEE